jgi:polar amino acid transport system substrate-binding protein
MYNLCGGKNCVIRSIFFLIMGYAIYFLMSIIIATASPVSKVNSVIRFITSPDYPPFEFTEHNKSGEIIYSGFDIDLAKLIAQELKKDIEIIPITFNLIFQMLLNKRADMAISTLTPTLERRKNFLFSEPYHYDTASIVFKSSDPMPTPLLWSELKVGCQIGSTLSVWMKEHAKEAHLIEYDHTYQAIESLKAGHIELVVLDSAQAQEFCSKNSELHCKMLKDIALEGYCLAFPMGSLWLEPVNKAIHVLKERGEIQKLEEKWNINSIHL